MDPTLFSREVMADHNNLGVFFLRGVKCAPGLARQTTARSDAPYPPAHGTTVALNNR